MIERFADRLEPETYRDDESWVVALVRSGRPVDWASALPDEQASVPERIAERLLALGRAYGLHHLLTLDGAEQNRLNADQAAAVADGVRFVLRVVADPALREHLQPLLVFAERCSHSKTTDLILEAP